MAGDGRRKGGAALVLADAGGRTVRPPASGSAPRRGGWPRPTSAAGALQDHRRMRAPVVVRRAGQVNVAGQAPADDRFCQLTLRSSPLPWNVRWQDNTPGRRQGMGKKRHRAPDLIEQLRGAVAGCGISMNRLGKEAGVNQAQLSRFIRGERTLTLPTAAKLCAYLGLRLAGPALDEKE